MRVIMSAIALAAGTAVAAFGVSMASAQSSASYPYCLFTDVSQVCFYTSMAQCMASRHGAVDFCEPNNSYTANNARGR